MDKTTKILLAAIAIGLWANVALPLFRPTAALAQSDELTTIARSVSLLARDLDRIARGLCQNTRLCG
jgi:hypothetical protein